MKNTSSKTALITGGNRGIGAAIVKKLKQEGYWVAACASSGKSRWESEPDLKLVCDVSKPVEVSALFEKIEQKFEHLDVVVCNAGLSATNPLDPGSSDETWYRVVDVNLHGAYLVSKAAIPFLENAAQASGTGGESSAKMPRGATLIHLSSVLGLKGVPDASAYCAAKHGVIGLTRSLSYELAPRGITVNAICPGWTRTDMALDRMREIGITPDDAAKSLPTGKIVEPSEIADACWFLASSGARKITGQTLVIDSGFLA